MLCQQLGRGLLDSVVEVNTSPLYYYLCLSLLSTPLAVRTASRRPTTVLWHRLLSCPAAISLRHHVLPHKAGHPGYPARGIAEPDAF